MVVMVQKLENSKYKFKIWVNTGKGHWDFLGLVYLTLIFKKIIALVL